MYMMDELNNLIIIKGIIKPLVGLIKYSSVP